MNKLVVLSSICFVLIPVLCFASSIGHIESKASPGPVTEQDNAELASAEMFMLANKFVTALKNGQPLSPLMTQKIVFIYHADDRCNGNTDGTLQDLPANHMDQPFITLQVHRDGEGWNCEANTPITFDMEFVLQDQLSEWDRFEMQADQDKQGVFYIEGKAESDYIIMHIQDDGQAYSVFKFEYRSEDPG